MHTPTPVQRIRRWHTYLVVWTLHRVVGLAVGILLILMSVTGGLLVIHHELERWLSERHPPPTFRAPKPAVRTG